eukprot:TRINITY_DN7925_c1_g1_i4.p1 TRINITY_DN7925_c1_g1~~TRINITY_DN7925_c1_g1_i4.p1  ORF type:complete len:4159 (-),score=593.84 TRINITY_DN7925_c1_g1_i4:104-12580(-)
MKRSVGLMLRGLPRRALIYTGQALLLTVLLQQVSPASAYENCSGSGSEDVATLQVHRSLTGSLTGSDGIDISLYDQKTKTSWTKFHSKSTTDAESQCKTFLVQQGLLPTDQSCGTCPSGVVSRQQENSETADLKKKQEDAITKCMKLTSPAACNASGCVFVKPSCQPSCTSFKLEADCPTSHCSWNNGEGCDKPTNCTMEEVVVATCACGENFCDPTAGLSYCGTDAADQSKKACFPSCQAGSSETVRAPCMCNADFFSAVMQNSLGKLCKVGEYCTTDGVCKATLSYCGNPPCTCGRATCDTQKPKCIGGTCYPDCGTMNWEKDGDKCSCGDPQKLCDQGQTCDKGECRNDAEDDDVKDDLINACIQDGPGEYPCKCGNGPHAPICDAKNPGPCRDGKCIGAHKSMSILQPVEWLLLKLWGGTQQKAEQTSREHRNHARRLNQTRSHKGVVGDVTNSSGGVFLVRSARTSSPAPPPVGACYSWLQPASTTVEEPDWNYDNPAVAKPPANTTADDGPQTLMVVSLVSEAGLSADLATYTRQLPMEAQERAEFNKRLQDDGYYEKSQLAGLNAAKYTDNSMAQQYLKNEQRQEKTRSAADMETNLVERYDKAAEEARSSALASANKLNQEVTSAVSAGKIQIDQTLQQGLDSTISQLRKAQFKTADLSMDKESGKLDSLIDSGGFASAGYALTSRQMLYKFGIMRGVIISESLGLELLPDVLDQVVDLTSDFSSMDDQELKEACFLTSTAPATELYFTSESSSDMQHINSIVDTFGASAYTASQSASSTGISGGGTMNLKGGAMMGQASFGHGKESAKSGGSANEASDSTEALKQTTVKNLQRTQYYFEPKVDVQLDRGMLQASATFLKRTGSLSWVLCQERAKRAKTLGPEVGKRVCMIQFTGQCEDMPVKQWINAALFADEPTEELNRTQCRAKAMKFQERCNSSVSVLQKMVHLRNKVMKEDCERWKAYASEADKESGSLGVHTNSDLDLLPVVMSFVQTNLQSPVIQSSTDNVLSQEYNQAIVNTILVYTAVAAGSITVVVDKAPAQHGYDKFNNVLVTATISPSTANDSPQTKVWNDLRTNAATGFLQGTMLQYTTAIVGLPYSEGKSAQDTAIEDLKIDYETESSIPAGLIQTDTEAMSAGDGQREVEDVLRNRLARVHESAAKSVIYDFGSHVCPQANLGGWRRVVAEYESSSGNSMVDVLKATQEGIQNANSEASSTGGSLGLSGTSFGGAVSGGKSKASSDKSSSDTGSGAREAQKLASMNATVSVQQTYKGGGSGLSPGDWRRSLSDDLSSNWKRIDLNLNKCIGVWEFIEDKILADAVCQMWIRYYLQGIGLVEYAQGIDSDLRARVCNSTLYATELRVAALQYAEATQNAMALEDMEGCKHNAEMFYYRFTPLRLRGEHAIYAGITQIAFRELGSPVSLFGATIAKVHNNNIFDDWPYNFEGWNYEVKNMEGPCDNPIEFESARQVGWGDYKKCQALCNQYVLCNYIEWYSWGSCRMYKSCSEASLTTWHALPLPSPTHYDCYNLQYGTGTCASNNASSGRCEKTMDNAFKACYWVSSTETCEASDVQCPVISCDGRHLETNAGGTCASFSEEVCERSVVLKGQKQYACDWSVNAQSCKTSQRECREVTTMATKTGAESSEYVAPGYETTPIYPCTSGPCDKQYCACEKADRVLLSRNVSASECFDICDYSPSCNGVYINSDERSCYWCGGARSDSGQDEEPGVYFKSLSLENLGKQGSCDKLQSKQACSSPQCVWSEEDDKCSIDYSFVKACPEYSEIKGDCTESSSEEHCLHNGLFCPDQLECGLTGDHIGNTGAGKGWDVYCGDTSRQRSPAPTLEDGETIMCDISACTLHASTTVEEDPSRFCKEVKDALDCMMENYCCYDPWWTRPSGDACNLDLDWNNQSSGITCSMTDLREQSAQFCFDLPEPVFLPLCPSTVMQDGVKCRCDEQAEGMFICDDGERHNCGYGAKCNDTALGSETFALDGAEELVCMSSYIEVYKKESESVFSGLTFYESIEETSSGEEVGASASCSKLGLLSDLCTADGGEEPTEQKCTRVQCESKCNSLPLCKYITVPEEEGDDTNFCLMFRSCQYLDPISLFVDLPPNTQTRIFRKPDEYRYPISSSLLVAFPRAQGVDEFTFQMGRNAADDPVVFKLEASGDVKGPWKKIAEVSLPASVQEGSAQIPAYRQNFLPWMRAVGAPGSGKQWDELTKQCVVKQCWCRDVDGDGNEILLPGARGDKCPTNGLIDQEGDCKDTSSNVQLCANLNCVALANEFSNDTKYAYLLQNYTAGGEPCGTKICNTGRKDENMSDVKRCCADRRYTTQLKLEIETLDDSDCGTDATLYANWKGNTTTETFSVQQDRMLSGKGTNLDQGQTDTIDWGGKNAIFDTSLWMESWRLPAMPLEVCFKIDEPGAGRNTNWCPGRVTLLNMDLRSSPAIGYITTFPHMTKGETICRPVTKYEATPPPSQSLLQLRTQAKAHDDQGSDKQRSIQMLDEATATSFTTVVIEKGEDKEENFDKVMRQCQEYLVQQGLLESREECDSCDGGVVNIAAKDRKDYAAQKRCSARDRSLCESEGKCSLFEGHCTLECERITSVTTCNEQVEGGQKCVWYEDGGRGSCKLNDKSCVQKNGICYAPDKEPAAGGPRRRRNANVAACVTFKQNGLTVAMPDFSSSTVTTEMSVAIINEQGMDSDLVKFNRDMPINAEELKGLNKNMQLKSVYKTSQLGGYQKTFKNNKVADQRLMNEAIAQKQRPGKKTLTDEEKEAMAKNLDEAIQAATAAKDAAEQARMELQRQVIDAAASGRQELSVSTEAAMQKTLSDLQTLQFTDADLSMDTESNQIDTLISSGGYNRQGYQLSPREMLTTFAIFRGVLITDQGRDLKPSQLDLVVQLASQYQSIDDAELKMLTQFIPDQEATEFYLQTESASDMQSINSLISTFGTSTYSSLAKGSSYGASVKKGFGAGSLSAGFGHSSGSQTSGGSGSSDYQGTDSQESITVKTLSRTTYYVEPKMQIALDKEMMEATTNFWMRTLAVSYELCKKRNKARSTLLNPVVPLRNRGCLLKIIPSDDTTKKNKCPRIPIDQYFQPADYFQLLKNYSKAQNMSVYDVEAGEICAKSIWEKVCGRAFDVKIKTLVQVEDCEKYSADYQAASAQGIAEDITTGGSNDSNDDDNTTGDSNNSNASNSSVLQANSTEWVDDRVHKKPNISRPNISANVSFVEECQNCGCNHTTSENSSSIESCASACSRKSKYFQYAQIPTHLQYEQVAKGLQENPSCACCDLNAAQFQQNGTNLYSISNFSDSDDDAEIEEEEYELYDTTLTVDDMIRALIFDFGSHVCPKATLGGWWRINAEYQSIDATEMVDAIQATQLAMAAASAESSSTNVKAPFVSHDSSSADADDQASDEGDGLREAYQDKTRNATTTVQQTWNGGGSGLSAGDWRRTLDEATSSNWRRIDVNIPKCIGIWMWIDDPILADKVCKEWVFLYLAGLDLTEEAVGVTSDVRKKACADPSAMYELQLSAKAYQFSRAQILTRTDREGCNEEMSYRFFRFTPLEMRDEHSLMWAVSNFSFKLLGKEVLMDKTQVLKIDPDYSFAEVDYLLVADGVVNACDGSENISCSEASGSDYGNLAKCEALCTTEPDCEFIVFTAADKGLGSCVMYKACPDTGKAPPAGTSAASSVYRKPTAKEFKDHAYYNQLDVSKGQMCSSLAGINVSCGDCIGYTVMDCMGLCNTQPGCTYISFSEKEDDVSQTKCYLFSSCEYYDSVEPGYKAKSFRKPTEYTGFMGQSIVLAFPEEQGVDEFSFSLGKNSRQDPVRFKMAVAKYMAGPWTEVMDSIMTAKERSATKNIESYREAFLSYMPVVGSSGKGMAWDEVNNQCVVKQCYCSQTAIDGSIVYKKGTYGTNCPENNAIDDPLGCDGTLPTGDQLTNAKCGTMDCADLARQWNGDNVPFDPQYAYLIQNPEAGNKECAQDKKAQYRCTKEDASQCCMDRRLTSRLKLIMTTKHCGDKNKKGGTDSDLMGWYEGPSVDASFEPSGVKASGYSSFNGDGNALEPGQTDQWSFNPIVDFAIMPQKLCLNLHSGWSKTMWCPDEIKVYNLDLTSNPLIAKTMQFGAMSKDEIQCQLMGDAQWVKTIDPVEPDIAR